MYTLAIDTSNQVLGVAITKGNDLIAEMITNIKKDQSSRLMPAIVDVMEKVDIKPDQLDKIVVANGPGSYTGTRIGVTTAKTLAWAQGIPIDTVSSLKAIAYNGKQFTGYICPFFDARRKTVFTSLYKWENNELMEVKDECNVLMEKWLTKLAELNKEILFLSPHMEVFKEMILAKLQHNAIIHKDFLHLPKPSNLILISEKHKNVPVHIVAPNYLRMTEAESNLLKRQKGEK